MNKIASAIAACAAMVSEKLLANLTTQVDHHFATGRRFKL
jgi:hypothetical protein